MCEVLKVKPAHNNGSLGKVKSLIEPGERMVEREIDFLAIIAAENEVKDIGMLTHFLNEFYLKIRIVFENIQASYFIAYFGVMSLLVSLYAIRRRRRLSRCRIY